MMKKVFLLTLFLCFVIPSQSAAQSDDLKKIQNGLEPLIQKTLAEKKAPGYAIGIIKNNQLIYAKGFGVSQLGAEKAVTPQSLFHMASVTKPFVATAVMQLVEQGKIDLDASPTKYLQYFRLNDERFRAITIRQMLSHISGIPDVTDYNWDKPEYDDQALERFVRSVSNQHLVNTPGEKFAYSNTAYEVLGDVIAKVSGESFEDYVQHNILTPLGMKQSTLLLRQANKNLLTTPHVSEKGSVVVSKIFPYNRAHAPSSTLYSNIEDMSRWAIANLNRGELDGKRILKATTYDLLWKPVADVGIRGHSKVGISWFLQEAEGHHFVLHSGGDVGFESLVILAPDDKIAVVAMGNYSGSNSYVGELTVAAMKLMMGFDFLKKQNDATAQIDQSVLSNISLDQVLEKFLTASGGKEAMQKITSRVSKGTFEVQGVALRGTTEIYEKAPNQYLMMMNMQGQPSFSEGFDGTIAWTNDPEDGVREKTGAELARAKRDWDFYRNLKLRELYPKLVLKGKGKVKDREAYLVEAPRNGNPKLWYFDVSTSLLLRIEERNAQQEIIRLQEFNDYREIDGLKIPFEIILTDEATFKIKLTEVKHGLAIEDAKFKKPLAK
jgi:CubicO group peptidase (beta-lactamase class C family)